MKKGLKVLSLLLVLLLLAGCKGKDNDVKNTVVCKLSSADPAGSYKLERTDTITKDKDVIKSIETKEVYTSDSEELLATLKQTLEQTYDTYNGVYGGYTNQITNENGVVTSTTKIDYSKLDIKKYASDFNLNDYKTEDGQLKVDGMVNYYEQMNATCK